MTHGAKGRPESNSLPLGVMSNGRSSLKPATHGRLQTMAIS
jgi:hypothetical protein